MRQYNASKHRLSGVLMCLVGLAISLPTFAVSPAARDDFFEMSLDELLRVEVTSVVKKAEPLSEAVAAVFVINQEDRRGRA